MSNQGKLLLSFARVQFSTLRGRKGNSLALDEGGFEISISRDFGFKHPMAKILTSRTSAEHVAFIEDQLLVTTLIRIQPQLKDIIKSSHVLSPYFVSNLRLASPAQNTLRASIPSFFIRVIRVVRFSPMRAAAPSGPPTRPFVSLRMRMIAFCSSNRASAGWAVAVSTGPGNSVTELVNGLSPCIARSRSRPRIRTTRSCSSDVPAIPVVESTLRLGG